ncbi:CTB family bacteriocin [Nostoc sp. FACHB-280]|uniref:CTB family bacteriocin n=1 Tax=Nostoc sp. FACHB-280 TaxID=2692839 RepID=UPI00168BB598|nr:CTB family bacteriocin [Nostoc sp. FACHB-280]MBD2493740.1 hypothetical protein [Nostoc sp. FACHB-280]
MSQELFTDLAIEQQETISGGSLTIPVLSGNLQEINGALFKQNTKVVQFATTATAGPNGASSTKVFSAGQNNILSKSGDILKFSW